MSYLIQAYLVEDIKRETHLKHPLACALPLEERLRSYIEILRLAIWQPFTKTAKDHRRLALCQVNRHVLGFSAFAECFSLRAMDWHKRTPKPCKSTWNSTQKHLGHILLDLLSKWKHINEECGVRVDCVTHETSRVAGGHGIWR